MDTHITVHRNTSQSETSPPQSFTDQARPVAPSPESAPVGDERRKAVNLLIVAAHAGYGTPAPQGEAMAVAVEVWRDALDETGVPTDKLRAMLKKCLAGRASNYPPGVSEICATWRAHLAALPTQTIQERDAQKRRALPQGADATAERGRALYLASKRRYDAGRGNVQCDCGWPAALSSDNFDWMCDGRKDRCDFRWSVADTFNAPIGKGKSGPMGGDIADSMPAPKEVERAPVVKREYSQSELFAALSESCNLDVDLIEYDHALQFARWMFEIIAPDFWTPAMAASEWPKCFSNSRSGAIADAA